MVARQDRSSSSIKRDDYCDSESNLWEIKGHGEDQQQITDMNARRAEMNMM